MEHCGEQTKKAAMKREGKTEKKDCGKYFSSRKKKGENGTRLRRGRNKEREGNEVVLRNFGSKTGKL